jgi:lysylphosphatidylglycerol synthetase-like protein (DUF2156 family)
MTITNTAAADSETDLAVGDVQRYADAGNPSAYLAFSKGNRYFRTPGAPGVIIYRAAGRYLVQFAGPFAPLDAQAVLQRAFAEHAAEQGLEHVAVQVQHADTPAFLELGYSVNQMGSSYAVSLAEFTLAGTRFMQLRNKISRALRAGIEIHEAEYAPWADRIRSLDEAWLRSKGEGVGALEFLVGQTGGRHQHLRRLFVATRGEELIGYLSYSPVYGPQPGWMHDLSRRVPDAPPGVMEAVNKAAIEVFRGEGVPWLHFGFTPFTSLDGPDLPGHSPAFRWFMHYLAEHGEQIYPARTQLAYKQKWAPDLVLPEYLAFPGGASLVGLVHVFRACNAL